MSTRDVRRLAAGLAAASALLLGACGDDDGAGVREIGAGAGSESGSASGSASHASGSHATGGACAEAEAGYETVEFTLDDFSISPEATEAPAGEVYFVATNEGEHAHEIVVVKGVAPDALPIEGGKVDESALPDGALLGEIEAFPPGDTCAGEFELEAGADYTLFCNVVEGGTSHVEEGMVTTLTAA